MATVRMSCPECCCEIETTSEDVLIVTCATTGEHTYSFLCPGCKLRIVRPTEPRVVELLVDAGVKRKVWRMPEELDEEHSGPKINHDDLLEFHTALERGEIVFLTEERRDARP